MDDIRLETIEMHTGGEPLRIVKSGLPDIHGQTILDKRQYIRQHLDHIRKLLIYEPRGHYDMYGVYLIQPDVPSADLGCIFIHNEGYSTMCGHAVIAIGRYAVDYGIVINPTSPETRVVIQCPCGPVEAFVEYKDGKSGRVRFNSVPAFLFAQDVTVSIPGYGLVTVDISYGGAFYALVRASALGLDLSTSTVQEVVKAASTITEIVKTTVKLIHPQSEDLAFLYGTILTDDSDVHGSDSETTNMCVFANKEVDRSPCGSGVTARIAQHVARGLIQINQVRTFVGPTGSKFVARAVRMEKYGPYDAVIVEVSGKGHYTGMSTFVLETDYVIGKGFLLE